MPSVPHSHPLDDLARRHATMEGLSMSPGKSSKRQALTYRHQFAAAWSQFVRESFDSPEHAAFVFGVDGSTARKWWEGSHAPSGFAVGYAFSLAPAAASRFLGGSL